MLDRHWAGVRFGRAKVQTANQEHAFEVQVFLDDIEEEAVRVELYADESGGNPPVRQEMRRQRPLVGSVRGYVYSATVPATRPCGDYTARVVPYFAGLAVPLEASQIHWQQ